MELTRCVGRAITYNGWVLFERYTLDVWIDLLHDLRNVLGFYIHFCLVVNPILVHEPPNSQDSLPFILLLGIGLDRFDQTDLTCPTFMTGNISLVFRESQLGCGFGSV